MKKEKYGKAAAALLAVMAVTAAVRAGGSDTLVTRAWLEQNLTGWARTAQAQALDGLEQEVLAAAEKELAGQAMTQAQMDELAREAAAVLASGGSRTVTLERGQRVTGPLGGGMVLESGTASVDSFTGNDLIDITAGAAALPGAQASVGSYYMVGTDNGCGLTVTSETAELRLLDGAFTKESYELRERKAKEEAKSKIQTQIIPQIIEKLEPSVDESLNEMKDELLKEVSNTINGRIQIEIDSLNKAKERQIKNKERYDSQISAIDNRIVELNAAMQKL